MAKEKKPLKINFLLPGETEADKEKNEEEVAKVIITYALKKKYNM